MRIESIFLKNYELISLSGIKEISVNFTTKIALVLGRNGCGKSSFLRECSPLPAHHSYYFEDGEKIICIEHNGNSYELFSFLNRNGKKGSVHTFVKNGVVILKEVNSTLQREKVIEEFGYTPQIHSLLLGDTNFTTMSTTSRREILQLISPLDLEYALNLYEKIKDKVREKQTIVNHLVGKVSTSSSSLAKLEVPLDLDFITKDIEEQLTLLLSYTSKDYNVSDIEDKLNHIKNIFASIPKRFKSKDDIQYLNVTVSSIEELLGIIGGYQGQISSLQNEIIFLSEKIENLSSAISSVTETSLSKDEIKEKMYALKNRIDSLPEYPREDIPKFNMYKEALLELEQLLKNTYSSLASSQIYDNESISSNSEELISLRNKIHNLQFSLEENIKHLNHLALDDVTCPNCKLKLTLKGENKEERSQFLSSLISDQSDALNTLNKRYKEVEDIEKDIEFYKVTLEKLIRYKASSILPQDFWHLLKTPKQMLISKQNTFYTIAGYAELINQYLLKIDLEKEYQRYNTALKSFDILGTSSEGILDGYTLRLDLLLSKKQELEKELNNATAYLKHIQKYQENAEYIFNQAQVYDRLLQDLSNGLIYKHAKARQSSLFTELGKFNNLKQQRELILFQKKELEIELQEQRLELEAFILLEKELSNKKGLIAEQMNMFMDFFVNSMNSIINEVWQYPLNIKPCETKDDSINYLFPVHSGSIISSDVADTSTSQSGIINLAFVMVVRQQLGLIDYPLYMDETGSGYDEHHRTGLLSQIKEIIHGRRCSQLFIINHYSEIYSGLPKSDVIVLDPLNITVPKTYNTGVTIKYE